MPEWSSAHRSARGRQRVHERESSSAEWLLLDPAPEGTLEPAVPPGAVLVLGRVGGPEAVETCLELPTDVRRSAVMLFVCGASGGEWCKG